MNSLDSSSVGRALKYGAKLRSEKTSPCRTLEVLFSSYRLCPGFKYLVVSNFEWAVFPNRRSHACIVLFQPLLKVVTMTLVQVRGVKAL